MLAQGNARRPERQNKRREIIIIKIIRKEKKGETRKGKERTRLKGNSAVHLPSFLFIQLVAHISGQLFKLSFRFGVISVDN